MTFLAIQQTAFRRLKFADSPDSSVSTRIKDAINQWHRNTLVVPGIGNKLRRVQITRATTASRASYGVPFSKILHITERSNDRRLIKRLPILNELRIVGILQLPRTAALQCGVFARMHITQIATDVHGLVVADQRMHHAALAPRLGFKFLHVGNDLVGVRAPVRQITDLHEMRFAGLPFAALVDKPSLAQHFEVVVIVAVDITNDDYPLDILPFVPGLGCKH